MFFRFGIIGFFLLAWFPPAALEAGQPESKAKAAKTSEKPPESTRLSQRPVRIRSGPGVYYDIIKRLEAGAPLSVLEEGERWVKVRHGQDTSGWVSSRVFTKRSKRRGYGALLGEEGLEGVSATVVTMATQGLGNLGAGGAMDGMIRDFLQQRPFSPDEWVRFARVLPSRPVPRLPDWMRKLGEIRQADDEQAELERRLGLRLAGQVLQDVQLITDAGLDRYVNQVGTAILSATSHYDQSWRFVIFAAVEAEAFALPGGFIFVSDGLLAEMRDEAELAGVLAHQVAHVLLAHDLDALQARLGSSKAGSGGEQRLQRLLEEAYRLARAARPAVQERAADAYGAAFALAAGYDPLGFVRFVQRNNAFEATGPDYPQAAAREATVRRVVEDLGRERLLSLKERFEAATSTGKL